MTTTFDPITDCEFYWNIQGLVYQDGYIIYNGKKLDHFSESYAISPESEQAASNLVNRELGE